MGNLQVFSAVPISCYTVPVEMFCFDHVFLPSVISEVRGSRMTAAVSPTPELPLPVVY